MVIHWSMTYNRHCRGIYNSSSVALRSWLLQPVAAQGGCWGPAGADQSSTGIGFLSFLPPQRPAAQPALPATEIFPGLASKWPLTVCPSTLVSILGCALGTCLVSGRMRQRVEREGGRSICTNCCCYGLQRWVSLGRARKWEYLPSASLASEWVDHGGALPYASSFFCCQKCWGWSVMLLKKGGKKQLKGNSHQSLLTTLWHQAGGHACIP